MDKYEGFFVLHRKLLGDSLWLTGTATQKLLIIVLIALANHTANEWIWKGQKVTIERGQTITSLASLKDILGNDISIKQIRYSLGLLEKHKFLAMTMASTGRIITILNYNKYQLPLANTMASDGQAMGKAVATNNNNKNDNKDKKEYIQHGKFVKLTKEEYQKLVEQFGEADTKEKIINLDLYIGSTGKKYADHYLTILAWDRRNKKSSGNGDTKLTTEEEEQKETLRQFKEGKLKIDDRPIISP